MGEDVDEAPLDSPVARYKTIARDELPLHPKVTAGMCYELVEFLEAAFIEQ